MSRVSKLKEEVAFLQARVEHKSSLVNQVNTYESEARRERDECKEKLRLCVEQLQVERSMVEEGENKLECVQAGLDATKERVRILRKQFATVRDERDELRATISEMDTEINRLKYTPPKLHVCLSVDGKKVNHTIEGYDLEVRDSKTCVDFHSEGLPKLCVEKKHLVAYHIEAGVLREGCSE